MPAKLQLVNLKFGRLTVLCEAGRTAQGKVKWTAQCDCGATVTVIGAQLTSGQTTSCGCAQRDSVQKKNFVHGSARRGEQTPEYGTWQGLIDRCENPNSEFFSKYGGRGITVSPLWRSSFSTFLADMGLRPSSQHSIDRINVDGNYEPGNCRWATPKEQANNKTNTLLLTKNGVTQSAMLWAEQLGICPPTLYARLARGWSVERALVK